MAIIGKVERKSWKVRILNASIHLILLLGAATMVYPLLLMISGSVKSDVDFHRFSLFPEYIFNHDVLYRKYLQTKYNGLSANLFAVFRLPLGTVANLPVPERPSRERFSDYKQFLTAMRQSKPHYWRAIGMSEERGVIPLTLREYRAWLSRKFGSGPQGLDAINKAYGSDYESWSNILLPKENFLVRRAETDYRTAQTKDVLEFKNTQITGFNTWWTDIDAPFVAALRAAYINRLGDLNRAWGTDFNTWSEITLPLKYPEDRPAFAAAWHEYIRDQVNLAFVSIRPEAAPLWRAFLREKYNQDLLFFNRVCKGRYSSFDEIPMPETVPPAGQLRTDWNSFILTRLPPQYLRITSLTGEYRKWLQKRYQTLDRLNQKFQLGCRTFEEIELPENPVAENLRKGSDWHAFADSLNIEDIGLSRNAIGDFRDFILSKYTANGRIDYKTMSLDFKQEIGSPHEIPFYTAFPASPDISSAVKDLYQKFAQEPANASCRVLVRTEKLQTDWVGFLKEKYRGDIRKLNRDWSLVYSDWNKIAPPAAEYEWFTVLDNRSLLIGEYLKRNYLMVFDTILTNGFAARNTLIYCALAVLASLLVNPLCAYGLSRFKMAPAYKILLFLMLPMAFPPMVLGIPRFLLIKNLGLLNTFAALILPSMANGYMIFLMKGFFDSLPKELFESAALDGAGEWTVFWNIAMSLSTPILSVLALNAFTAAYGNFMMAFLLCQDKSMWTMMVYLYQLQQHASQAVGFAALIIAAIPTLLVFIFCQNIIIKGIVVPSEK